MRSQVVKCPYVFHPTYCRRRLGIEGKVLACHTATSTEFPFSSQETSRWMLDSGRIGNYVNIYIYMSWTVGYKAVPCCMSSSPRAPCSAAPRSTETKSISANFHCVNIPQSSSINFWYLIGDPDQVPQSQRRCFALAWQYRHRLPCWIWWIISPAQVPAKGFAFCEGRAPILIDGNALLAQCGSCWPGDIGSSCQNVH